MEVYTQADTSQNSASSIVDGSYKTQSEENTQKLVDFRDTLQSFPADIGKVMKTTGCDIHVYSR